MSAPTVSGEVSRVSMRPKMETPVLPFKSHKPVTAFERLGAHWGCKADTAKDRIYGERGIYQMVADANEAFLADGLAERVAMLMAPVDASMFTEVPSLAECIHAHNKTDAREDLEQAEFIRTAGDAELGGWITNLVVSIRTDEKLLAALVRERETRKAGR